jgi:hypothetical protein
MPSSLIRLPNTVHEVSGKRKEIVSSHLGNLLKIEHVETPRVEFKSLIQPDDGDKLWVMMGVNQVYNLLNYEPSIGNRYIQLWSCGENLMRAVFSREYIEESLYMINSYWANRKEDAEIDRCIKDLFKG